ncbi:uncharacterized protein LOC130359677 [Hyla sarda]|uniref:uncharacterized protein LOC130359677 n=1 Tax=Hyla sarda TaxID=327740 RepID=UPI0024C2F135|nr:uncharacterized protein LOC130359677 [Hyla sarda]
MWQEVGECLIPNYETLSSSVKTKLDEKMQKKWRSVRDAFKRYCTKEEQASKSGSGASKLTVYKHANSLQFLRKCFKLRKTTSSLSSTLQTEQIEQTEGSTLQSETAPPVEGEPSSRMSVADRIQHQIMHASRRQRKDHDFRDSLMLEGFQKIEDSFESRLMSQDLRILRLEGEWSGEKENADRQFLLSLLPGMSTMTYSEKLYFQRKILNLMTEIDKKHCQTPTFHEPSPMQQYQPLDPQTRVPPSTPQRFIQYGQPQVVQKQFPNVRTYSHQYVQESTPVRGSEVQFQNL